jgi:PAS domain S-box-containing protein
MIPDQVKTKRQLTQELADLRERIAALEAAETERAKAEASLNHQTQSFTAVSELAINLAAAPPHLNLLELIADGLKSITAALGVVVSTYDNESCELTLEYIAAQSQVLSQVNKLLGRNIVGLRVPVGPEMKQRMLTEIIRIEPDLSNSTLGMIPRPIAAAIQQALGIDHFIGLALHYGGDLMGTAVMVMSKGQAALPTDMLRLVAHLAAVSLRRKQAEEALRENEELYRMLVETSPDGIALMDLETNILTANKELASLLGWERAEELTGKNGFEFLSPKDHQAARDELDTLSVGGALKDRKCHLIRKDGTVFPAEVGVSAVVDAHNRPNAMIGVVRDISKRERMEKAMRLHAYELDMLNRAGQAFNASLNLDEVLATTLEKTCDLLKVDACSIWLTDPESGELVCDSAVGPHEETVRGWRLAPGKGLAGWIAQSGQSLIVPDSHLDERYDRGVERKTGWVPRSILGAPLRAKKEIIGVIEVLSGEADQFHATDRTLLESVVISAAIALDNARLYKDLEQRMEELQRTQAWLIQSAKMAAVGELAAGVAHELNNPLTAVLGFSELLLERAAPDAANRTQLEAIVRQAGRVRDIVSNLLSFSRQTDFHLEMSNLTQVLRETLALIRLRLKASDIVVREQYAADMPLLPMDTGRMKQVFLNLITNSLQANGRKTARPQRAAGGRGSYSHYRHWRGHCHRAHAAHL